MTEHAGERPARSKRCAGADVRADLQASFDRPVSELGGEGARGPRGVQAAHKTLVARRHHANPDNIAESVVKHAHAEEQTCT